MAVWQYSRTQIYRPPKIAAKSNIPSFLLLTVLLLSNIVPLYRPLVNFLVLKNSNITAKNFRYILYNTVCNLEISNWSLHDGLVADLPLACFLLHKCVCFDSILISSHISLIGRTFDTWVTYCGV